MDQISVVANIVSFLNSSEKLIPSIIFLNLYTWSLKNAGSDSPSCKSGLNPTFNLEKGQFIFRRQNW